MLGAGELLPACHDDVIKGEKAAVVERLGMILRLVCAFGFVGKSHTFLFLGCNTSIIKRGKRDEPVGWFPFCFVACNRQVYLRVQAESRSCVGGLY